MMHIVWYLSCIAIGIVSPLCPGFSIPSPRPRLEHSTQPRLTNTLYTKTSTTEYQLQQKKTFVWIKQQSWLTSMILINGHQEENRQYVISVPNLQLNGTGQFVVEIQLNFPPFSHSYKSYTNWRTCSYMNIVHIITLLVLLNTKYIVKTKKLNKKNICPLPITKTLMQLRYM